jgi:hypothetical protein
VFNNITYSVCYRQKKRLIEEKFGFNAKLFFSFTLDRFFWILTWINMATWCEAKAQLDKSF